MICFDKSRPCDETCPFYMIAGTQTGTIKKNKHDLKRIGSIITTYKEDMCSRYEASLRAPVRILLEV